MLITRIKPSTVELMPGRWFAITDRIDPNRAVAIFRHREHAISFRNEHEDGVMEILEVEVPA